MVMNICKKQHCLLLVEDNIKKMVMASLYLNSERVKTPLLLLLLC